MELMSKEGVEFVCNTDVGQRRACRQACQGLRRVVFCTGATKPRDLPIEGRNAKGVHFAMDFLTANTKGVLTEGHFNGNHISPRARTSSSSAAATPAPTASARRCATAAEPGAGRDPAQAARGTAADNPWPEWPKTYKMDYGQEEAAAQVRRRPTVYLTTVKKFIGDANGHVSGVHGEHHLEEERQGTVHPRGCSGQRSESCRRSWCFSPWASWGRNRATAARTAGFRRARSRAATSRRITEVPDQHSQGLCRRRLPAGQSLVVWAINEGRGAGAGGATAG
jgi:glutamate synthase (NADPH/NADH) small chain